MLAASGRDHLIHLSTSPATFHSEGNAHPINLWVMLIFKLQLQPKVSRCELIRARGSVQQQTKTIGGVERVRGWVQLGHVMHGMKNCHTCLPLGRQPGQ
jgi:hypothetical protein